MTPEERIELVNTMMGQIADSEKSTKHPYIKTIPNEGIPLTEEMDLDLVPYTVTVDDNKYAKKGKPWWSKAFIIHRKVGIAGETVVCPKTYDEKAPCPVCKWIKTEYNKPEKLQNIDYIKDVKKSERVLYNVLKDNKIYLFDISKFCFGALLTKSLKFDTTELSAYMADGVPPSKWDKKTLKNWSKLKFWRLEEGQTLSVKAEVRKIGASEFTFANIIEFNEREDLDKDIVKRGIDLDNCLEQMSYEELEALFEQAKPIPKVDHDKEDENKDVQELDNEANVKDFIDKGAKSTKKEKICPVAGGVFGNDCEDYTECEECESFMDCNEKKQTYNLPY